MSDTKTPEQIAAELADATKVKDEAIAEAAKLRKQIAEMSGKVLSDEDRKVFDDLKAQQATAEEEKKKKAGEWDNLRNELTKKNDAALAEKDAALKALDDRFRRTVVQAEFGRASDLFGGDTSKTILDVDLAIAALGGYVHVDRDDKDPRGYKVVVKKADGTPIVGKDGNPNFAEAMTELIGTLPNKDRILRGSGKTGSGNSGGHGSGHGDKDLDNPKSSGDFNDPKVREAVRKKHNAAGGIQSGSVFDRKP